MRHNPTKQANAISNELRKLANPNIASHSQRFFKTGPGEYGEGDKFLGIRMPVIRQTVKKFKVQASILDAESLIQSPWHEERMTGLLILVAFFENPKLDQKKAVYESYLKHKEYTNNWDLVDLSAPKIMGPWLENRNRQVLYKLLQSKSLWDRRIAVLSCMHFIKQKDFTEILHFSEQLLNDPEDLIHKACGWMLREMGKRDLPVLYSFLDQHVSQMPRTMLRYAIEKLPEKKRKAYLNK